MRPKGGGDVTFSFDDSFHDSFAHCDLESQSVDSFLMYDSDSSFWLGLTPSHCVWVYKDRSVLLCTFRLDFLNSLQRLSPTNPNPSHLVDIFLPCDLSAELEWTSNLELTRTHLVVCDRLYPLPLSWAFNFSVSNLWTPNNCKNNPKVWSNWSCLPHAAFHLPLK